MIPFSKTYASPLSQKYVQEILSQSQLASDGPYSKRCLEWLQKNLGAPHAMLTPSCTAGLELAALLCDLKQGDEVILPSYTFSSCANAFALRGATPVFVDVLPDTFNIDATTMKDAFSAKTKAVLAVHYAGVSCDMDPILELIKQHSVCLIEDSAQAIGSRYKSRPLGTIGAMSAFSFHYTKNIIAGEGGALLINDQKYAARADIIREKGTNRKQFMRGEVDKYTWVDVGSSFLPSELSSAFLLGQLEECQELNQNRLDSWQMYHDGLADLEKKGFLRRQIIPEYAEHNAHMYVIVLRNADESLRLQKFLKENNVQAVSHYVPLHSSPFGRKIGRTVGDMKHTDSLSSRLLRLPMYHGVSEKIPQILAEIERFFRKES